MKRRKPSQSLLSTYFKRKEAKLSAGSSPSGAEPSAVDASAASSVAAAPRPTEPHHDSASVRDAIERATMADDRLSAELLGVLIRADQERESPAAGAGAATTAAAAGKLTPLEKQILEFKAQYPGVLLAFQVGYKVRFFGADARSAARALSICCFQDRVFLSASIPVLRLTVHVRRLVEAGFRVAVVGQAETAALKRASGSKDKLFKREVKGIYSKATLLDESDAALGVQMGALGSGAAGDTEEAEGDEVGAGADAGVEAGAAADRGADAGAVDVVDQEHGLAREKKPLIILSVVEEGLCGAGSNGSSNGGVGTGGSTGGDAGDAASAGGEEHKHSEVGEKRVRLGICAVDVRAGRVVHDVFEDDAIRAGLDTRLRHLQPLELLIPQARLSDTTERVLQGVLATCTADADSSAAAAAAAVATGGAAQGLGDGSEGSSAEGPRLRALGATASSVLWATPVDVSINPVLYGSCRVQRVNDEVMSVEAACRVLDGLRQELLARNAGDGSASASDAGSDPALAALSALSELPLLAKRALGGLAAYLSDMRLERALVAAAAETFVPPSCMRLDGNVVRDLELLANLDDGSEHGSLLWVLRHTRTPYGYRRLRQWLLHPLTDASAINARLDAVEELTARPPAGVEELLLGMGQGPDLERSLARLHAGRVRPAELLAMLSSFDSLLGSLRAVQARAVEPARGGPLSDGVDSRVAGSTLLHQLLEAAESRVRVKDALDALVTEQARAGCLHAMFADEEAAFPELAATKREMERVKQDLDAHLVEVRRLLRMPQLQFLHLKVGPASMASYLVQLPNADAGKAPADWVKVNSTKKMTRFHTPRVVELLRQLDEATERRDVEARLAWLRFARGVDERYHAPLARLVESLAELDCLQSLAVVAKLPGYSRPCVVPSRFPPASGAVGDAMQTLRVAGGRHPMADLLMQEQYVPNDVHLETARDGTSAGTEPVPWLVVTGPNMGGKSSYVRTMALLAVMAQVGSRVPAESMTLTPFDAVFTRMGATDDTGSGLSTFMVELAQTSEVLQSATRASLVVLDELGRGTSTHDGAAIAKATLRHLARDVGCLGFFITHYNAVARMEGELPRLLRSCHMSYLEEEPAASSQDSCTGLPPRVTFLYRCVSGAAPRSYGLNVARMAGVTDSVLRIASRQSRALGDEVGCESACVDGESEHC